MVQLRNKLLQVISPYHEVRIPYLVKTPGGRCWCFRKAEKIGNKFLRTVAQYGINIGGEAFEEGSCWFWRCLGESIITQKMICKKSKISSLEDHWRKMLVWELYRQCLVLLIHKQYKNIRDGRNLVTGLHNKKYIDEIAQQRMVEAQNETKN